MKSKIKVIVIGLIILCLAGVYAIIDKALFMIHLVIQVHSNQLP